MKNLLSTTADVATIAQHYHYTDELLMIRRSSASRVPLDRDGNFLSMRDIMPTHDIKTMSLSYAEEGGADQVPREMQVTLICSLQVVDSFVLTCH